MIGIEIILLSIIVLFLIFVSLRQIPGFKFCALCASVSFTWLSLLALWFSGFAIDPALIAMLMGASLVGVMYLAEKKLHEKYHIFRLPYLITGFALIYDILKLRVELSEVLIALILWTIFGTIFLYRNNPKLKDSAKKIIECCKNW